MTSIELAKKAAQILENKKAIDTNLLGIKDISSLTDYFVIATGTSNTHIKALADELEFQLKQLEIFPDHIEGRNSNTWILLDYGNVIVHLFSQESRDFYNLERLWKDSQKVDI